MKGVNFTNRYLDDILIYSSDVDTPLKHLHATFERKGGRSKTIEKEMHLHQGSPPILRLFLSGGAMCLPII